MTSWVLAVLILVLAAWALTNDLSTGKTYVSGRGFRGTWIRRSKTPLLFYAVIAMKALMGLLLISLVNGWFMTLIQWSI